MHECLNPFLANASVLYPQKTPENLLVKLVKLIKYSQINRFVVLNLLNFMITNNKFINFGFSNPTFYFLVVRVWVPKPVYQYHKASEDHPGGKYWLGWSIVLDFSVHQFLIHF